MESCFFCDPDRDRVLYTSEHFYVLLGLGPIVEGYVILVAKEHTRSMFDLPTEIRGAYEQEKRLLKAIINDVYGPSIITEHGRIQACIAEDEKAHDLMCYHAHQLFFPLDVELGDLSKEGPFEKVFEGSNLFTMSASTLQENDEYLLFENSTENVSVYTVRGKCPRQFLRYLVGRSIQQPELANWQQYPGYDSICAARDKYTKAFPQFNNITFTNYQKKSINQTLNPYCRV